MTEHDPVNPYAVPVPPLDASEEEVADYERLVVALINSQWCACGGIFCCRRGVNPGLHAVCYRCGARKPVQ